MDLIQIRTLRARALAEGWNFSRQCDELRRTGVARIRMVLHSGATTFFDAAGNMVTDEREVPSHRECAQALDPPAIETARQRFLQQHIDLETLFAELAVAGVWYFELDTRSKTVRHFDWKEQLHDVNDDGYAQESGSLLILPFAPEHPPA